MKVKNRVKKGTEFQKVISDGTEIRGANYKLYFLSNNYGYPRVGISVPTKIGHAVVRNKIKRQIRAMIAQELNFDISNDLVIIVKRNYDTSKFNEMKDSLADLLKKVGNTSEKIA